jgi:hypothetical protein
MANKTIKGRKYLSDLNLKESTIPQYWGAKDDNRQKHWDEEREIYGFDQRETWSLDFTFKIWLFERLSMYNEANCIDTNSSFHKIKFKGEVLTFQECIDKMLDGLKLELTTSEYSRTEEQIEKIDDVVDIFALCHRLLWW